MYIKELHLQAARSKLELNQPFFKIQTRNIAQETVARTFTQIPAVLSQNHSTNLHKNHCETREEKAKDIEGAVAALNRINDALAMYRQSVYKSEFNEELPKPNHPDLISSKRYSNMTYQKGIDQEGIKKMVGSILEIPNVLYSKAQGITNAVTGLVDMAVGQSEAFAYSKAYTWRVSGDDGNDYLFTAVVAAAAIDTANWGIREGVACQAAMTFVFKAGGPNLPYNPKHDPEDPATKKPLKEIM
ncbi:hypothetical protein BGX28_000899 [Mortierella sp. GBA30]|nr:hypothetical protein BGX28_000899 [Mortierella sp. GBA30]